MCWGPLSSKKEFFQNLSVCSARDKTTLSISTKPATNIYPRHYKCTLSPAYNKVRVVWLVRPQAENRQIGREAEGRAKVRYPYILFCYFSLTIIENTKNLYYLSIVTKRVRKIVPITNTVYFILVSQ